jgi:hypothetical protein
MFQNNNNKDEVNINTRAITLKNKDGFEPSALALGFWNDMVNIKIHPALDKSKRTEFLVYDWEQALSTALKIEKIEALIEIIDNDILPAIAKGEDKSKGVPVGGNSLVMIGTGKGITGSIKPFVSIHKNLSEETHKPEVSMYYEFKSTPVIEDYNPNTGKYELQTVQLSELLLFRKFLESSVFAQSAAEVHSIRYSDRWFRDKLLNDIKAIAEKLGVQVASFKKKSGPDIFGVKGTTKDSYEKPAVSESIDDLDQFM